jgi:3-oxoacyl-[acyl-carrier-protein] synthase II
MTGLSPDPPRRAVAVTGLGVTVPGGPTLDDYWRTLVAGRSCAVALPDDGPVPLVVSFGCPVNDPGGTLTDKERRRLDRFAQFALSAALAAVTDAGVGDIAPATGAVISGVGFGGLGTFGRETRLWAVGSPINPLSVPMVMANAAPAAIAMRLGWTGPSLAITTACASGTDAIGQGARMVAGGWADVVLAGGAEAPLNSMGLTSFHALHALSSRTSAPELASRPFDADRDGFVLGEGAAFCVLEPLDRAIERGRRPYAVIAGYAQTNDAFHLVAPLPDGAQAEACMRRALREAGVEPSDVVHINAHGTSTRANDATEALAIDRVFGTHTPPVTSTKGVIGHLIGAAGAAELVACCLALRHGLVPPTANFDHGDPDFKLDVVAGAPRPFTPGPVLSNSFAFGGHNASLVLAPSDGIPARDQP